MANMERVLKIIESLSGGGAVTAQGLAQNKEFERQKEIEEEDRKRRREQQDRQALLTRLGIEDKLAERAEGLTDPDQLREAVATMKSTGEGEAIPTREPSAEGVEVRPSESIDLEETVQGVPKEVSDILAQSPGSQESMLAALKSRVIGRANLEDREFEKSLERDLERLEVVKGAEYGMRLEYEVEKALALAEHEFDEYKKRAVLQHMLAMQRDAASRAHAQGLKDAPKPENLADATAISVAQSYLSKPDKLELSVGEYRQEIMGHVIRALGEEVANVAHEDIIEAVNDATRYYNPKINKSLAEKVSDFEAAVQRAEGVSGAARGESAEELRLRVAQEAERLKEMQD